MEELQVSKDSFHCLLVGTFGRSAEPSALVDRECEFGLGATNKIIIYINAVVIVIAVAVAVYVNIIVVYFLVNFTFVEHLT